MRLRRSGTAAAVAATALCVAALGLAVWVNAHVPGAPHSVVGGVWAVLTAAVGAGVVAARPGNAVG
ncbi:hypothetical protein ACI797_15830 [Geodermatophilus sp. SYSU D00691]